jgi:hypothetical protein
MTRNVRLGMTLLAAALMVAAGCKGKPADDEASIQKALQEKGTLEVLNEVAAAEYDPPADGRLTAEQIEMYLAVKRREQRIHEVASKSLEKKSDAAEQDEGDMGFVDTMRALGDVGDIATADLRAAQELGHNPKEYQWVEERVMEALLSQLSQRLQGQLAEGREQYLQMLEAQKQTLTDPAQRAKLDEQIAEVRRQMGEQVAGEAPSEVPSDALRHNIALVGKYREQIKAVLSPEERFAVGEWEGEKPVEPPPAAAAPQQP